MSASPNNTRLVFALVGLVAFMGAMSFAAVPLYNLFCRVTGYGGTTQVASTGSDVILDRTMKIRFDASVAGGAWVEVKPEVRDITLRIGETALAFYVAHNPSSEPVATTASFNVVPFSAGSYFIKVECFCFTQQIVQPGETVRMPVSFYVDPDIVDDPEASYTREITLSYTFHHDELPEDAAQPRHLN